MLTVAVPMQEGRTPAVAVRAHPVTRRADDRIPRLAGIRVRLTGGLNSEKTAAAVLIVPEASSRWTRAPRGIALEASSRWIKAPSEIVTKEVRQRISVAEGIKACHPPKAAVAVRARAVAAAV
jgi:hypothetical protein